MENACWFKLGKRVTVETSKTQWQDKKRLQTFFYSTYETLADTASVGFQKVGKSGIPEIIVSRLC